MIFDRRKTVFSFFIVLQIVFINQIFSQKLKVDWVQQIGSAGYDEGIDLVLDNEDNIIFIGLFSDTLKLDNTLLIPENGQNSIIAKIDSNENILWINHLKGLGNNKARSLKIDNFGDILVCGEFSDELQIDSMKFSSNGNKDFFLAKFDKKGKLKWCTTAGGTGFDTAADIKLNDKNEIILVGRFFDTIELGDTSFTSAGSWDVFISKLDEDGNFLWSNSFAGDGLDRCWRVDFDAEANIYMGGIFQTNLSAGSFTINSQGFYDIYLMKLDSEGTPLWLKRAGSENLDQLYGLVVNGDKVFVTGLIDGEADFDSISVTSHGGWGWDLYIAAYDLNGNIDWVSNYGSAGADQGRNMILENSGDLLISGMTQPNADFGDTLIAGYGMEDSYFLSLDTLGNINTIYTMGGSNSELANGAVRDSKGNYYVTGKFLDYTQFENDSLLSFGDNDIYIVKLVNEEVTGINNKELVPNSLFVSANYPNPFNPSTKFNVRMPFGDFINIVVYNSLGEKVNEIYNGFLEKGEYEFYFNGSNLASGVYFYKLETNKYSFIRKMMLLK